MDEKVYVRTGTPETFNDTNNPNLLPGIEPGQYLVRLENAARLRRFQGVNLDQVIKHLREFIKNPGKTENKNIVKDILLKWNRGRDPRPLFAGFWGEVKDIFTDHTGARIENEDWANRLRDRFGLGHLNPEDDSPIPVVMFRYQVSDVLRINGGDANVIAVPTVLDSIFSPFFCPTPKNGWTEGQALDLSSGDENNYSINSEILHRAIEFEPGFLYNAGWITRSPGKTLEQAREIHFEFLADSFENRL